MSDSFFMTQEEKLIFTLRSMWRNAGYTSCKVSQAEEYDFYVRNKEFLDNRQIITFTDRDGVLMALKSDVTLSLVKKIKDADTVKRVMYNEKIYRIPEFSSSFREIEQTGLECLGPLTTENIVEVVSLALSSLGKIGGRHCLTLSHMGIINSVLEGVEDTRRDEIISLVKRRKIEEIERTGEKNERERRACSIFLSLLDSKRTSREIISYMRSNNLCVTAVDELEAVISSLGEENVVLDFSSLGAFGYYNGIIMKGFVEGFNRPVLLGGEYSLLLRRMKRNISRALGFAIYMDEMEEKEK